MGCCSPTQLVPNCALLLSPLPNNDTYGAHTARCCGERCSRCASFRHSARCGRDGCPAALGPSCGVPDEVHRACTEQTALHGSMLSTREQLSEAMGDRRWTRSEEHTSELQSLMRISYAVFCLKKKKN